MATEILITGQARKMGPLSKTHPLALHERCAACKDPFAPGDYVTLISLGPGDDEAAQDAARQGHPYNAVAVPVHWACATGERE